MSTHGTADLFTSTASGHQEGFMTSDKRHGSAVSQQDPRLVRVDDDWLRLPNRWGIPVDICAGADVPIESSAVDEVLAVLETADTLERLSEATGATEATISKLVLT